MMNRKYWQTLSVYFEWVPLNTSAKRKTLANDYQKGFEQTQDISVSCLKKIHFETHTATNYSPLRIPWILCDFFIFYFISYTSLWNYKMDWHFKAYSSGIVLDPKLGRVGSFLTDEIFILLMVGAEFVDERDVAGLGKAGLFIQQGKQTQRPLWRREIEIRFTVKDTIKHGRIILWLQSGLHDAQPKVALVDPTACRENLSVVG